MRTTFGGHMRGFQVLVAMAALCFNLNNVFADDWGVDEAPSGVVTIPMTLKPIWTGGPRALPPKWLPCPDGTVPAPSGTTDAYKWDYMKQLHLDRNRAHLTRPKDGTRLWMMAAVTTLKGKTAIWCVTAPKNAVNAPPRKEPQLLVGAPAPAIELKGPLGLPVLASDTQFAMWLGFGGRTLRGDILMAPTLGFRFRQGWYLLETDLSIPFNGSADSVRRVGWNLAVQPIGWWLGSVDVGIVLRGGLSGASASGHPDELQLGIGAAASFRPLWWVDGWWSELLEFHGELLATQAYHKGDDFSSTSVGLMGVLDLRFGLRF